jgi:hypothetical protein
MKIFHAAFAALLITGSMFVQPAHAQSTPQEYRTSCTDARVEDRTVCRFADGGERTSLTDVNRCVGDIGNDNGWAPMMVVPPPRVGMGMPAMPSIAVPHNGALTCAVTGSQWRRTVGG